MSLRFFKLIGFLLALAAGSQCFGDVVSRSMSLSELWVLAQSQDAQYRSAQAQFQADQEVVNLARASLLPAISASVQSGDNRLKQTTNTGVSGATSNYQPMVSSLRASVTLFDRERSLAVQAAILQLERSELLQKQIQGELAARLANAFYSELLAQETTELAKAQLDALSSQAERASQLFKGGVATRTDVEETASRMQLAKAQWQQSISQVRLKRVALERVVGALGGGKLLKPSANEADPALSTSLDLMMAKLREVNPAVLAQKKAVELAGVQLSRAQAGHLPTLALSATRSAGREPSQSYRSEYQTAGSLSLNIPIYEGGRALAASRQQTALLTKAQSDLDAALVDGQYSLMEAYTTLFDSKEQAKALELAQKSAQVALEGMRVGQQAGLRTNTDVLSAEQQLYSVRRDILREELSRRLAALQLRLIMGESVSF